MKVALRFDANHALGLGHLYRCMALAQALIKRNHEPVFVTRIYSETAEALMSCGIDVVALKPESSYNEDAVAAGSTGADAVVVDMLDTRVDYIQRLTADAKFVLTLDDNGDGAMIADKVVNVLYSRIQGTNVLSDFSYAILREGFAQMHDKMRDISGNVEKILVLQGGADTHGIMAKILSALDGSGYEITAVAGTAFKSAPEAKKGLKVLRNVDDMAAVMADADIAITAAGISLLELLCVGTPAIAVCAEKFEEETAKKLENKEAAVNLGFGKEISEEKTSSAVNELAKDYEKRKKMSERGKELVDGKGAERIAELIERGVINERK